MTERYLAIETSSPRLSLAIGDEHKALAAFKGPLQWRHAETLFQGMQKLLSRRRWSPTSLTGVAVSIGPGSFTGIRIGLAAARALGQALKTPVVGVSSLEIMAVGAAGSRFQAPGHSPRAYSLEPRAAYRWFCPMIVALRGQVFSALFRRKESGGLERIFAETMTPAVEWLRKVKARVRNQSLWISPLQGCYPDAGTLLDLARPRLAKAGPESYKNVLPLYIRRAAAEERRR